MIPRRMAYACGSLVDMVWLGRILRDLDPLNIARSSEKLYSRCRFYYQ